MSNEFKKWDSKEYLEHYYADKKMPIDEVKIFKFINAFLKKHPISFDSMIDVGSGPTIHRVIPFVPYVNKIYLADYLESNLKSIKNWVSNKGYVHNWNDQIKHVMQIEQKSSEREFNDRIESFKTKLFKLLHCDVTKVEIIKLKKKFPLVISFYCIDSITKSKKLWAASLKNVTNLVEPGGWVLMSALRNTKYYNVNGEHFPSPCVNENDYIKELIKNGFLKENINVKIIPSPHWQKDGIDSLLVLSAQKAKK